MKLPVFEDQTRFEGTQPSSASEARLKEVLVSHVCQSLHLQQADVQSWAQVQTMKLMCTVLRHFVQWMC